MTTEDVKKLSWIPVTDWTRLPHVISHKTGTKIVARMHLNQFLRDIFNKLSYELDIPYTEIQLLMLECNSNFFNFAEKLFSEHMALYPDNPQLRLLQSLLLIPDTSGIQISKAERLFNSFERLTKEEQKEFLQLLALKEYHI